MPSSTYSQGPFCISVYALATRLWWLQYNIFLKVATINNVIPLPPPTNLDSIFPFLQLFAQFFSEKTYYSSHILIWNWEAAVPKGLHCEGRDGDEIKFSSGFSLEEPKKAQSIEKRKLAAKLYYS